MRLPCASRAQVDKEKILNYLLCRWHPEGGSKARFFERFGFNVTEWERLAAALQNHADKNSVSKMVETGYGKRYIIDGPMETPDGRRPYIRTVWMLEQGTEAPRLVTAHPIERPR